MSWGASADLGRSAHEDTCCRDHSPPREHWPKLVLNRPELAYPDRPRIRAVEFVPTLARTSTGKVQRSEPAEVQRNES